MAIDEHLLGIWSATELIVEIDDASVILNGEDGRWPFPVDSVRIITGFNPDAKNQSLEKNEEANGRLAARIDALDHERWPCLGRMGDWEEPGFATTVDLADAILLGRDFEQVAIFDVDEDEVCIVECATGQVAQCGSRTEALRH